MEFDSILTLIGEFGRYQRLVYFTICLTQLLCGWNFMGIVFLAGTPDHWCAVPELELLNLTRDVIKNTSLPRETKDSVECFSRCHMFDVNYSNWTRQDVFLYLNQRNTSQLKTIPCSHGWMYDHSLYGRTIVTQWNLVCDKTWMVSTASSTFMAGLMVGVVLLGALSDRIGRRKTLLLTVFTVSIFVVALAFSPNIYVFFGLRFLVGLCSIPAFTTAFVIAIELVGRSWRVEAGIIIMFYWAVAYLSVAGLAYFIRDWVKLELVLSLGSFICYVFYFIVPESPRWLYANNRPEEGEKILRKAAKMNGTSLPEKLDITVKTSELDGKANIIDLVRTPRMRIRTINMCFNWFVNGMVYYGLSLNTSNLGGNPYVNAAISAAVEIPGYMGVILVLNRVGRRLSLLVSLLVGGAALLATCTIPPHLNFISIALAMTGKFFVTCSFAFIYLYSAEIFPTVVRNVAIGCASLCARMGALLAPYIAQLSDTSRFIPLITFGTLAIAAGGLSLLFPETKGNILPETVEDAENFGRHKKKNQRDVEMKEPHLRKSILSANEEAVQTIY